mmetsp:Transcript_71798/g.159682  ORF Transcript_71798/g.159682 Transcript_71798/m.159682 type:complete len:206 (-) Transcript_71798:316-933(-)
MTTPQPSPERSHCRRPLPRSPPPPSTRPRHPAPTRPRRRWSPVRRACLAAGRRAVPGWSHPPPAARPSARLAARQTPSQIDTPHRARWRPRPQEATLLAPSHLAEDCRSTPPQPAVPVAVPVAAPTITARADRQARVHPGARSRPRFALLPPCRPRRLPTSCCLRPSPRSQRGCSSPRLQLPPPPPASRLAPPLQTGWFQSSGLP